MADLTVTKSEPLPSKGLQVVKSEPLSEDKPVLLRALHNLPSSLLHFGQNMMPVGRGDNPPLDEHGDWRVTGPFEDIGNVLGSLLNIPLHPEESFANDPVGTVAYPLLALKGGWDAARNPTMGNVMRGAKTGLKEELPNVPKWSSRGAKIGGVIGGVGEGGFGGAMRGAEYGGLLGGAFPLVRGAFRGGLRGVTEGPGYLESPRPISGSPTVGRFDPDQYGAGSSPTVPPVETGGGHVPDYSGPTIQPIEPVTSELSGRPTTGRFDVSQYGAPPARPSSVSGYSSTPIKPATVDLSKPESMIPPIQPSTPASEIVTGLHLPEVPRHYAGEPNPTAAFKNDQAIVAELRKVPGITQDSLTPDMVHEVRKALGQRRLKDVDVERRVQHIRHMLPK